jgi:hypothetical protein
VGGSCDAGSVNSVPTGFTEVRTEAPGRWVSAYGKIASADDAAATDFTFGLSGTIYAAGVLYRITGTDTTTPFVTSNSTTASGTASPTFAAGVTPPADCILVMGGLEDNAGSSIAIGSYAIATSNPTWTERLEAIYAPFQQVVFSATSTARSAATATGDFSCANSNGDTANQWIGMIIAVQPPSASGPANLKSYNTNVKANIKSIDTNVIANVKSLNTNV